MTSSSIRMPTSLTVPRVRGASCHLLA
ncbi:hypothetical protein ANCCAN_06070 [Ancylostoma caninum]|uniref:Uncharacterized protein n=1 Tax=Ancylostoma caninum TaxID=29170 RepID=A0A368GU22_ANCCA|nr:hypothetical protein ANCCAN_06070 [Ancylostoma caninum]